MDSLDLLSRITTNRNVLDGKPSIRGQSIAVEDILSQLADRNTVEGLLIEYPALVPEDIQACLLYAKTLVQQVRHRLSIEDLEGSIPEILDRVPYLTLLVLFGSRARGDATSESDWDFALLCDEEQRNHYEKGDWDSFRVWEALQTAYDLADDAIDVVEMKSCSELLAHYIAKDGHVIYERSPGLFSSFKHANLKSPEKLGKFRQNLKAEIEQKLERLR